MFSKTARYYDLIYAAKDYEAEARNIEALIHREHPGAKSILDAACGTGEHARFLARSFQVDGIDILPEFVEIAQQKLPESCFRTADMSDFDMGECYDVVLCLFGSIGYLTQAGQVLDALCCFKQHLNPGGVVIVEPWFTPDQWQPGTPYMAIVDQPDLKICRISTSEREGNLSRLYFHYLIGSAQGVEHLTEEHVLAMYTREEMLSFFVKAGLAVHFDEEGVTGRGVYIAR